MKEIKKLPLGSILFISVQTATQERPSELSKESLEEIRDRFGTEMSELEVVVHYEEKCNLMPEYSRIICIALGYVHEGEIKTKVLTGEEDEIINQFYSIAGTRILCSFSCNNFDIPYIRLRALSNGIEVPEKLDDRGKKPWEVGLENSSKIKTIDILDSTQGIYPYRISVNSIMRLLKIDHDSANIIEGFEVNPYFYSDRLGDIANYALNKVFQSIKVVMKLRGEEALESTKQNILKTICDNKAIDISTVEVIKDKYQSYSEEDKEKLKEILVAAVVYTGEPNYGMGKDDTVTIDYKKSIIAQIDEE